MNKTLTRALLARPVLLAAGTAASALVNPSLLPGPLLVWIGGIFGGSSLAVFALWWSRAAQGFSRHAVVVSAAIGLLGWTVLAVLTGGLESPFVAAIFLEIALAVVTMGPVGVLGVAGSGVSLLVLIETLAEFVHGWQLLLVESLFILAIGGLAAAMSVRRRSGDAALVTQRRELGQRLESLQRELEDERVISRVGENVARLAHGLKNAVHSLRGFVSLIEPQLGVGSGKNAAMAGLHAAIDDLEKLARLTLVENRTGTDAHGVAEIRDFSRVAAVAAVVEEARRELTAASPEVSWTIREANRSADLVVGLSRTMLLELLVILMRNGVEAMDGRGRGTVEYGRFGERCWLTVTDEGKGMDTEQLSRIFHPGYTTKTEGSGFGLFLARRIVEDHGGTLDFTVGESRGAVVRVELPLCSLEGAT